VTWGCSRASSQTASGRRPDPDDDGIRRDDGAVTEPDAAHRTPRTLDRLDRDRRAQVDAVRAVEIGEHLRELRPEHPHQGQLQRLEHHHIGPCLACGRRDLEADPAPAHEHQPRARLHEGPDAVAVLDRPKRQDPAEVSSRQAQDPG
jgi:hypothetical protein